jgi:hypothetical protein
MACMTAEEYAADAMRKKADAKRRRDWAALRDADAQLQQACRAIRSRGANWTPPTKAR